MLMLLGAGAILDWLPCAELEIRHELVGEPD